MTQTLKQSTEQARSSLVSAKTDAEKALAQIELDVYSGVESAMQTAKN